MKFREWLYKEVRHMDFHDHVFPLIIDGRRIGATDMDFHFEDYDQTRMMMVNFVQEIPHEAAAEKGQVIVNMGWDGYWWQTLSSDELSKLHSGMVFGNADAKQLVFEKPELGSHKPFPKLEVNALDKFSKIPAVSIIDKETKEPAKFHPPYDQKSVLHWWDFVEVTVGSSAVKKSARLNDFYAKVA